MTKNNISCWFENNALSILIITKILMNNNLFANICSSVQIMSDNIYR